jgi:simple sugar transport system ATP-binding protein
VSATPVQEPPLLEVRNVGKYFGNVIALSDVSLTVRAGEVTCILGDNGAGKSTLIKAFCGVHAPDEGELLVDGRPVRFSSPREAKAFGIATVYQDLAMVPLMSIWRNFFLGSEPQKGFPPLRRFDVGRAKRISREQLAQLGIDVRDPDQPVGTLSGGERQAVAIARAMYFESELIILDEPTNNLGVAETQGVLRFVRNARDSGHSCIFIAHNIHHVFQVVDRIVVLRRGRVVADAIDPKATTIEQVERVITGELEFVDGEMRLSAEARAAAAAAAGGAPSIAS